MQKSEPILIGDLLRQMFSDPRIKALIDDYGMMGLGTYIYLCNTIDAQSPGGLPLDYVIKSASSHASRNRIRNVLRLSPDISLCHCPIFIHYFRMPFVR